MVFQKVIKGINSLSADEARNMVSENGIICNWWRNKHEINNSEIKEQLTEINLMHHLIDYSHPLPTGHRWEKYGKTFGDVSPFISATAGAVQRDTYLQTNIIYDPFITALNFATLGFTSSGFLFYAYVITIGKKSVALSEFAEEVRELHIYTRWLPFYHEGEIAAKICIPSVNIEKAEYYDGSKCLAAFQSNTIPKPDSTIYNPAYESPENYNNVRELL